MMLRRCLIIMHSFIIADKAATLSSDEMAMMFAHGRLYNCHSVKRDAASRVGDYHDCSICTCASTWVAEMHE